MGRHLHPAVQQVDRSVDVAVQKLGVCLSLAQLGAVTRLHSTEDGFCLGVAVVASAGLSIWRRCWCLRRK